MRRYSLWAKMILGSVFGASLGFVGALVLSRALSVVAPSAGPSALDLWGIVVASTVVGMFLAVWLSRP